MSYSIGVLASSKVEARAAAEEKFNSTVIATQPVHMHDKAAALANVDQALALVSEPAEGQEISVSMHGYMSFVGSHDQPERITNVAVSTTVSLVNKAPA